MGLDLSFIKISFRFLGDIGGAGGAESIAEEVEEWERDNDVLTGDRWNSQ